MSTSTPGPDEASRVRKDETRNLLEAEIDEILDTFMNKVFEIGSFYKKPTPAVMGDRYYAEVRTKEKLLDIIRRERIDELETYGWRGGDQKKDRIKELEQEGIQ